MSDCQCVFVRHIKTSHVCIFYNGININIFRICFSLDTPFLNLCTNYVLNVFPHFFVPILQNVYMSSDYRRNPGCITMYC